MLDDDIRTTSPGACSFGVRLSELGKMSRNMKDEVMERKEVKLNILAMQANQTARTDHLAVYVRPALHATFTPLYMRIHFSAAALKPYNSSSLVMVKRTFTPLIRSDVPHASSSSSTTAYRQSTAAASMGGGKKGIGIGIGGKGLGNGGKTAKRHRLVMRRCHV